MKQIGHVLMTADTVGGVWTYAMTLCRRLASVGTRVSLATMGDPVRAEQRNEATQIPGLQLFEGDWKLEWMHDPWIEVDAAGEWLLNLERKTQPDIVHLNGYSHAALPFRRPKLVVAHSCVLSWWRAVKQEEAPSEFDEYRERVKEGLRGADHVVAPSSAMLTVLKRHYYFDVSSSVIPNGLEESRDDLKLPKEPFVLSCGRLWDEAKNVSMLAHVAPQLSCPTYVAGESREPGRKVKSIDNVQCLGQLAPESLRRWYARAAVYVLPARYEPFGLSVLEAAQAGCALVLGDIPSLRENWNNAAVFVHPDNPRSLLSAIQALMANDGLRERYGEKARRRAAEFPASLMGDRYLALYAELLQNAGRSKAQCVS
ncbi:MAG TPA: glycosyltransferase family 4 protein [Bryobacteraceae bacterium]|jgi:glycosyltransferase involved in cell wall biosynthesis|nr:glycosyltransferase family 4 protein [Bryobacteraceae bacterium]